MIEVSGSLPDLEKKESEPVSNKAYVNEATLAFSGWPKIAKFERGFVLSITSMVHGWVKEQEPDLERGLVREAKGFFSGDCPHSVSLFRSLRKPFVQPQLERHLKLEAGEEK
ncbi:hypothetical protein ACFLZP_04055 [Patescibacteria group bacterium]